MSRKGEVLDSAAMEAWNSAFKAKLGERFETNDEAEAKTFDYIEVFYNRQRASDFTSPLASRAVTQGHVRQGGVRRVIRVGLITRRASWAPA